MRQQALREEDAGARSSLSGPVPLSRVVRNAADYRRWQADLSRRRGDTSRAAALDREADAIAGVAHFSSSSADDYAHVHGLEPRVRFRKPEAPLRCEGLRGPNVIRFKFRDRSGVSLRDDRLVTDAPSTATRLDADLAVIASLGLRHIPAHTSSRDELDRVRREGELASGQELPDVTQWFEAVAGPRAVVDLREDREACERTARVVNTLNALDNIEVAYVVPQGSNSQTWVTPPPPVDIAPTTPGFESASMDVQTPTGGAVGAVVGLDSPELLAEGEVSELLQDGWQGATIRIVISESADPDAHEKVNYFTLPGMNPDNGDAADRDHAVRVASVAFGSARSGNSANNPRYGMRGHAPLALGGSHSIEDVIFVPWAQRLARPGLAIEQMAPYLGNGDVINFSYGLRSGLEEWGSKRPIETDQDANDKMHLYGANGIVFINAANNEGTNLDQHGFPPKPPTSYIVGSSLGQLVAPVGGGPNALILAPYSNWGPRVNFWGPSAMRYPDQLTPSTLRMPVAAQREASVIDNVWDDANDPFQRYAFVQGTSLAAPELSGAFAQMQGLFRRNFGWRLGTGDGPHGTREIAAALRSIGVRLDQGVQPNLQLVATERMLAVRLSGCGDNESIHPPIYTLAPPYRREVSVLAPGTVQFTPPAQGISCLMSFPGGTGPVELHEVDRGFPVGPLDLDGPALNGFTIEARVRFNGATNAWQQVVAKESPRNYGMWITPSAGPWLAGRLHFSYFFSNGATVENCARYGLRNVADGQLHHVAAVFDAGYFPPRISLYVDGVPDGPAQTGCAGFPLTSGGPGQNMVEIGRDVASGTQIGDVRLYHYPASASRITSHHLGVQ
jgi:hypothetical protein